MALPSHRCLFYFILFLTPREHLSPLQADFYLNDKGKKGAGGVQLLQHQGKTGMIYAQVSTTAK